MANMETRIKDLATRIGTECKSLRTLINGNATDLSSLTTTAKSSLLAAINELDAAIDNVANAQTTALNSAQATLNARIDTVAAEAGAQIADTTTSSASQTWSIDRIKTEIQAAKNALSNGAAAALDTLAELAAAIGNDASFAATVTTALGNRVRTDAAMTLTAEQKLQACQNMGIGDPDANFVTSFTTGLV